MADFTKQAIRETFISLLNEKPLKQISVKDIVDRCGVNRNTFYYHFQDIPQLVETIVREDADSVILSHFKISSFSECVNAIVEFVMKNKQAVLHIYRSVNRDIYEQYQWRLCEHVSTLYLQEALQGRTISEADKNTITHYMTCVCFGIVMDWLEHGLNADIQEFVQNICKLKIGDLEDLIKTCTI